MKHIALTALLLFSASTRLLAGNSDDPVLDAKINVAELGSSYADKHPKMAEARARLDALSRTTPEVPPATYRSHLQDRIDEAQREDWVLSQKYRQHHPARQRLAEKLKFLRDELQRVQVPNN